MGGLISWLPSGKYDIISKSWFHQSMHIYFMNKPAGFYPSLVWNNGAVDLFQEHCPNNKKKNKMSIVDIRSVSDPKILAGQSYKVLSARPCLACVHCRKNKNQFIVLRLNWMIRQSCSFHIVLFSVCNELLLISVSIFEFWFFLVLFNFHFQIYLSVIVRKFHWCYQYFRF